MQIPQQILKLPITVNHWPACTLLTKSSFACFAWSIVAVAYFAYFASTEHFCPRLWARFSEPFNICLLLSAENTNTNILRFSEPFNIYLAPLLLCRETGLYGVVFGIVRPRNVVWDGWSFGDDFTDDILMTVLCWWVLEWQLSILAKKTECVEEGRSQEPQGAG